MVILLFILFHSKVSFRSPFCFYHDISKTSSAKFEIFENIVVKVFHFTL